MNEPMNERLQELLEMFLHRGCTPAEEKELFDACLHDPNAAETVRQQLILSLKIKKLRDEAEVPLEVRNELFRKINTIAAEAPAEKERKRAFVWLGGLRLGWSHAVVAGAAAALAVVLVLNNAPDQSGSMQPQIITEVTTDTVHVHTVDTLREVETVRVPVYIQKEIASEDIAPENVQEEAAPAATPDAVPNGTDLAEQTPDTKEQTTKTGIAAARDMQVTKSNFREKYSEMVANTDKIQLTEDDRVRL